MGAFSRWLVSLFLLIISCASNAIDNPHFYRALRFWDEPRFERPWLNSWQLNAGFATTRHSRNPDGSIAPLWDIIGPQNLQFLGANVPNLDPTNPIDQLLIDAAALPTRNSFGTVSFNGEFAFFEIIGQCYQNIINGFFFQAHLPLLRSLTVSNINFTDLSPDDDQFPNKNTPAWQNLLSGFGTILSRYQISIPNTMHRTGIGDLSLLAGWARTYQNTEILDFIDVSAKIGVLFPTAATASFRKPFELPLGYNGHFGLPLKFDCSFGAYGWLTLGFHQGALFLFKRTPEMLLKTSELQNGFILLAREKVKIDPGTIWEIGTYAKADHVVRGLSFYAGYSFTKHDDSCIELENSTFDTCIINNDERFKGWDMHTFHASAEYDFADSLINWGPRIGVWFNIIVGGRRIFNAHLYDSLFALECLWHF
jgi:hypothetical protein